MNEAAASHSTEPRPYGGEEESSVNIETVELTKGQKAAKTRAANKAIKEATEGGKVKIQAWPNPFLEEKLEELTKEVEFNKRLLLAMANYKGLDNLMVQMGVPFDSLHKLTQKEIRGKL